MGNTPNYYVFVNLLSIFISNTSFIHESGLRIKANQYMGIAPFHVSFMWYLNKIMIKTPLYKFRSVEPSRFTNGDSVVILFYSRAKAFKNVLVI